MVWGVHRLNALWLHGVRAVWSHCSKTLSFIRAKAASVCGFKVSKLHVFFAPELDSPLVWMFQRPKAKAWKLSGFIASRPTRPLASKLENILVSKFQRLNFLWPHSVSALKRCSGKAWKQHGWLMSEPQRSLASGLFFGFQRCCHSTKPPGFKA